MKEHFEDLEQMKQEYEQIPVPQEGLTLVKEAMERAKKGRQQKRRKVFLKSFGWGAAAVLAMLVMLPNISANVAYAMSNLPIIGPFVEVIRFQDYQIDEERFQADVEIPELVVPNQSFSDKEADTINLYADSVNQINQEIRLISRNLIKEFKEAMQIEGSYGQLLIKYEILKSTEDYFTLKLITYWGGGSGFEKDYFYTVDLHTGKRLSLSDLFYQGADYKGIISENIRQQMRSQMETEDVVYWIDQDSSDEVSAWNFEGIKEDQSFYIDEKGQIAITFSEGEVAPMAYGCVEFVIPNQLIESIRISH